MAKTKNVKPTRKLSEGARILDLNYGFSWRQKPICDAALEKLADDLVQWATTTDEIDIEAFFAERNLNLDCVYDFMERNACFKEAYTLAKQKLGVKRSRGVAHFKLKDTWLKINQHHYQPMFGKGEERAAQLKDFNDDNNDKKITIIVKDNDE